MSVKVTTLSNPPYAIVITSKREVDDENFPVTIAPDGGFQTREEAKEVADHWSGEAGDEFEFAIVGLREPGFFKRFLSF